MYFSQSIRIDNKIVSNDTPAFVIAEIGVNHNGDFELAKRMIDTAASCHVDAVKFQSFYPEELLMPNAPKAAYQLETTNQKESQFEMLQKLVMPIDKMKLLKEYTESLGVLFLSTPFDERSLDDLMSIDMQAIKVSSTDTTNLLFLKKIAQKNKPIILSTGMCTIEEVHQALETIYNEGNSNVILLHCTSNYPTNYDEVNMLAILQLKNKFNILVGYSDHTEGVGIAPYTIPLGAKVIEKHFTLDKTMEGPDHLASLNGIELEMLVKDIRRVESALGDGIKAPTSSEVLTKERMQKKLVIRKPIQQQEILLEENLTAKRSSNGIPANQVFNVIGKKVKKSLMKDELLSLEDLYE